MKLCGLVATCCWLMMAVAHAQPCDPCALANGRYRAVPPADWDGKRALPVLLFVHGWQSTADSTVADDDVRGPAGRQGFLLLAPDGIDKRWGFRGSQAGGRDDLGFLQAVVQDAATRFPIDRRLVVAAGFSIGASMVWDLACHAAAGFTAFLPISGGFWEPLPVACEAGPVNLRQTHGTGDTTFPLAGRPVGRGMRQGDVRRGFALWRTADDCTEAPDAVIGAADLTCSIWRQCRSGRQLQFCLHADGHMIYGPQLEAGLIWARGLPVP